MIKLEDNLKRFPSEFALVMEEAKEKQLVKVISFALKEFELQDDVKSMTDQDQSSLARFLRQIYEFGFYSGVNFTLDPEEFMKDDDNKE